ncbi:WW domain-binding protein 11-like, partial [Drosophila mauritiana]|uniref:WW domain-binding protein 11-like n=1 Tax=Drosophila mauritiana TaxID=7226 RepID=A0A6P8LAI1_DROMA
TEGAAEVITLSSESEEDDDGGETVTPEVSSDEDKTDYRSVRRATQGQGRISLGVAPPTEDPVDMRRFMEARVATLRRFQQIVDARKVADAEAAWQERLARLQEEEEALWAPTTEQPEPKQPLARQLPPTPQPPLPLTPPPTRPPSPQPLSPPPRQPPLTQSPPPTPPRMTVTQSPMETEDAPEDRVWEEAGAIGWRTPDQESRDPRIRAEQIVRARRRRSRGRRAREQQTRRRESGAGLHQVRSHHHQGCRG